MTLLTLARPLFLWFTKQFTFPTCHTFYCSECSYDWMTSRLTTPQNSWLNNQLLMIKQLLPLDTILKMNCWFCILLMVWFPSFGQESPPYYMNTNPVSTMNWPQMPPNTTLLMDPMPDRRKKWPHGSHNLCKQGTAACLTGAISFHKSPPCYGCVIQSFFQDVSPVLCNQMFFSNMQNAVQILSISSLKILPQDHLDPQTLANNWGIGIKTAKQTMKITTQYTQHCPVFSYKRLTIKVPTSPNWHVYGHNVHQ